MKTVQMTLDEDLIKEVDKLAKKLHTTRSAFTRAALKRAIQHKKDLLLEEKHRKGYELHPVKEAELLDWEDEQDWGGK
ncbi:ribbon-helix-helix domain-containing protein [Planctomycetota bacterium]